MKAITKRYSDQSFCLVEGKIENGKFVVTSTKKELPTNIDIDSLNQLKGENHFNGVSFMSECINDEFLSTFYIITEKEETETITEKGHSEVFVNPVMISDNKEIGTKSDTDNNIIFGKNNW